MKTNKLLGGLAVGAMVGVALGAFFNPTTGKKNREKIMKVSQKVSEELVKDLNKAKKLTKKEYDAVVNNIIKKYSKDDLLDKESWLEIKKELSKRWTEIRKELIEEPKKKTVRKSKKK